MKITLQREHTIGEVTSKFSISLKMPAISVPMVRSYLEMFWQQLEDQAKEQKTGD